MKVKSLEQILENVRVVQKHNYSDCQIEKITHNSVEITDNSLFVAIRGYATDGHKYLKEAEKKGAVAAIVEKQASDIRIPQIEVVNSRDALAQTTVNFFQPELSQMRLIGITGTNGKTTTSLLIKSIMESAGIRCGLIGTIYYQIGKEQRNAWNTTPESADLCRMFYEMYQNGQRGCVLEVSSHALALRRVNYLEFETAVFTNLTQDHLDFHKNMEEYFTAKKSLFSLLKANGTAVINCQDDYGQNLIQSLDCNIVSFGSGESGDIRADSWQSHIDGLDLKISTGNDIIEINSPLIGEFNVENILAAVSTGLALGIDNKKIIKGIEDVSIIPGRLETIKLDNDVTAVVDYAHTPDALEKAINVLRELTRKQLWVVFGCGGDRDKTKRPIMGRITSSLADRIIITSDNPRSEDPDEIIADIISGIEGKSGFIVESDRKKAIESALCEATQGDTILIAGKGHEDYQEINGIKHPFDDRLIVKDYIA
jgi:UDP-N-acetylmuramoyl-L-alanyl-D-glutamate--2,6-diaminopimelate ligase